MNNQHPRRWLKHVAWCIFLVGIILEGWVAIGASVRYIRIEHTAPFFSPNSVTVSAGTPIRWENNTGEAHTIIADECIRGSACRFDSGIIRPFGIYQLLPLPPGRHSYHCGLHPFMRGTITVAPPKKRSTDI